MTTEALGIDTVKAQDAVPWVPDDSTFAARLAMVRHRMGWNIKESALACNVPQASWRSWELDGSMPRNFVQIARQIADRTGCSFLWLMDAQEARRAGVDRQPVITPKPKLPERPSMRHDASVRPKNRQPDGGPRPRTNRVPRPGKA